MRNARVILVALFMGLGLLGAYFGVRGEDPRFPWPPAPVVPPAKSDESEVRAPKRQPLPPPPRPVATPEIEPVNPVALASFETKASTQPAAQSAAPPPVQVPSPPPEGRTPEPAQNVNAKPLPASVPPKVSPTLEPTPQVNVAAPPQPEQPGLPALPNEPLIVLPGGDIAPKDLKAAVTPAPVLNPAQMPSPATAPSAVTATAEPLPPAQPLPTPMAPVGANRAPNFPTEAPAPATPPATNVRVFQLANPVRRQGSAPPETPSAPERPMIQAQPVAQANPVNPDPLTNATANANATPQVTVEKRGPANPRAGEPVLFTITVRNIGPTPANEVRVEDEIPAGVRVTSAEPQPLLQGDRAVWVLPALLPGAQRLLKIEVDARGGGELAGKTSVVVSATTGTRDFIEPAAPAPTTLSLSVKAAPPVAAGLPVVFEVVVTNHGKQELTGLVLHGTLPAGLSHQAGKEIEADVGNLGPGVTRTYKMPVTAARPGRHTIDVKISTPSGLEAKGQGTVQVKEGSAGLTIRQPAIVKLFLEKESDLRIDVTNGDAQGLKNVTVLDTLPEGVEFIAASDQGLFRADARLAHWLIDYLAPGQTKRLMLRVRAKASGEFVQEVAARTESQQETRSSGAIQVEGISNLVVKIADHESAVEVGKHATYEITVTNQGSAPATGVQVQAVVTDGLTPAQARGPTRHRVAGRQVAFASLPKLQPQGQAVYYVTALAQAPGNQRFRAQVTSDQDGTPIAREERTFVYRD